MLSNKTQTITVPATVVQTTAKTITLQFNKDRLERLCNALGLYKKEFLESLDRSEKDHQAGRVYKIKNLMDIAKA